MVGAELSHRGLVLGFDSFRRLVFQVLKRLAGRADVAMPKVCRGKVCGS